MKSNIASRFGGQHIFCFFVHSTTLHYYTNNELGPSLLQDWSGRSDILRGLGLMVHEIT